MMLNGVIAAPSRSGGVGVRCAAAACAHRFSAAALLL